MANVDSIAESIERSLVNRYRNDNGTMNKPKENILMETLD